MNVIVFHIVKGKNGKKGSTVVTMMMKLENYCWFHVMMNVKKKLKSIKSIEKRQKVRLDICPER